MDVAELVKAHPGLGVRELARLAGRVPDWMSRHLRRAVAQGRVVRVEGPRRRILHYPPGKVPQEPQKRRLDAKDHALLDFIAKNPGCTRRAAASAVDLAWGAAHLRLARLEATGHVTDHGRRPSRLHASVNE